MMKGAIIKVVIHLRLGHYEWCQTKDVEKGIKVNSIIKCVLYNNSLLLSK